LRTDHGCLVFTPLLQPALFLAELEGVQSAASSWRPGGILVMPICQEMLDRDALNISISMCDLPIAGCCQPSWNVSASISQGPIQKAIVVFNGENNRMR
jgi:hypothetical protein